MLLQLQRLSIITEISRLIELCKTIKILKQIHAQITIFPSHQHHDYFISRLLFFTAITNSSFLAYAARIFQHLQNPTLPLYNIMIRAHASSSPPNKCFRFYKQMVFNNIAPDNLTFPFLIKGCSKSFDSLNGRGIHGQVIKVGFDSDVYVQNSLIGFYCKFGFVGNARKVFDEMSERDVVSWNSMIIGNLRSGRLNEALCLFRGMEKRNVISWNSIITGFVQGGRAKESLELFREMLCLKRGGDEGFRPDKITVASVLSACAYLGAIDHGKWVHGYLRRCGLECDVVIRTALVDMYGKCGSLERAYVVFRDMPDKDTSAWTAMISVLGIHGHGNEAFDVFEQMVAGGVKPNHITFVALLSACAHSGLIEKGRWCFNVMRSAYSIEPRVYHYACMVDILARAGQFEEAERLITSMPMEPDEYVLGALLSGCQMHCNFDLGERVVQRLIDLQPLNHAFYVNLCDIYAKAGRFDDVKSTRALMKERGIKKEVPGCSMIEIDGVVYEFSVLSLPGIETEESINLLTKLNNEMKIKGGDFVLQSMS